MGQRGRANRKAGRSCRTWLWMIPIRWSVASVAAKISGSLTTNRRRCSAPKYVLGALFICRGAEDQGCEELRWKDSERGRERERRREGEDEERRGVKEREEMRRERERGGRRRGERDEKRKGEGREREGRHVDSGGVVHLCLAFVHQEREDALVEILLQAVDKFALSVPLACDMGVWRRARGKAGKPRWEVARRRDVWEGESAGEGDESGLYWRQEEKEGKSISTEGQGSGGERWSQTSASLDASLKL